MKENEKDEVQQEEEEQSVVMEQTFIDHDGFNGEFAIPRD